MFHLKLFLSLSFFSLAIFPQFNSYAAEDDVYDFSWLDKDKEVYVLQNRKFRKKNKVYFGGTVGRSVSGAFIDSTEGNLIAGYFFSEDWGLEFSYTNANGQLNKTHDAVNDQGAVAFYKKIETAMTAMLMWAPFYSKINTFNKIFYYDWLFGVGVSNISTLDNRNEFDSGSIDADELTSESESAIAWMTGIRFYITQNWSTRLDFRATHVNTEFTLQGGDTEKRWNNYYNFNVGLNYSF
ncbi:MAG: hypothetical protein CME62_08350 [Halobacteriovoraceae bacterium]|nr:hypothetical protein [Halobacteriovoraceae bacterium]|tara:strand:+ start:3322 stop:4038 length:717 start_codon:yes stop_codon:yes gene_type:complete